MKGLVSDHPGAVETPSEPSQSITEAPGLVSDLDLLGTQELVELMNSEDTRVPAAVAAARSDIAAAVEAVVERLRAGGRLVYVGAGTSGRIAALDADECEATFSSPPGQVVAVVAGGSASPADRDAAEDDREAGAQDVREHGVSAHDAVVGISASGQTPYVLGAVEEAVRAGAATVAVVSAPDSELARIAQRQIEVVVGPEVIAGSTRLKAGTAQKLVVNMISTISMIRLGRTFGNLMVDVRPGNEKLRARQQRVVALAAGAGPEDAERALAEADGDARVAIVALLAGVDVERARARLREAGGSIRGALR